MRVRNMSWQELCQQAFEDNKFVCMGIDPPFIAGWKNADESQKGNMMNQLRKECIKKIRAVGLIVGFIKPNWAFFVQYGWRGLKVLEEVVAYAQREFPNIAVILDMKVGDIGETNRAYVRAAFNELSGDAITIHPYLGKEANNPFLEQSGKGIIILCHTSNPGAGEFQHLPVGENDPLFLKVAGNVAQNWNTSDNCALVTGATYPDAISKVRSSAAQLPLLIPGIGKQGGDLEASVRAAKRQDGYGFIMNASSSIFGSPNPNSAAQDMHDAVLAINSR